MEHCISPLIPLTKICPLFSTVSHYSVLAQIQISVIHVIPIFCEGKPFYARVQLKTFVCGLMGSVCT